MKTPHTPHLHAIGLSLVGLLTLAVAPAPAEEIIRWGHYWYSSTNPSMELKLANRAHAHIVVPVQAMTISQVAFMGGTTRAGSPIYHVGIQGDDATGNHYPNGEWLGGANNYAATAIPSNGWIIVTLPETVSLAKGERYHLVVKTFAADNDNFSSIMRNHQNVIAPFRVQDGIYDTAAGMEWFNGSSWSRAHSLPIMALDTVNDLALGQPWRAGENYTLLPTADNRYGQTFTLDLPVDTATVELVTLGLYISTVHLAPMDDLRVHLMRENDPTHLVSAVLIDKEKLPSIGFITVAIPPTRLHVGERYILVAEATNLTVTANGYYRIGGLIGAHENEIPLVPGATFQGTVGSCVRSVKNGAWTPMMIDNGRHTDLTFEFGLRIPPQGTMLLVR